MKEIEISTAATADIRELARLFDAYRVFYGQSSDLAASGLYVAEEVGTGKTQFLLARDPAGAVLGFVHLIPGTNTLLMRPMWYLEDLFVDPPERRNGVAQALMQAAEHFARENCAERLTLATAKDNFAAQALYAKLGYEREEHFRYYHRVLR